jgi:hypothetical protein
VTNPVTGSPAVEQRAQQVGNSQAGIVPIDRVDTLRFGQFGDERHRHADAVEAGVSGTMTGSPPSPATDP